MKVYVASSMQNIPAVRKCQEQLRAAGHTITHDWTAHEDNPWPSDSLAWRDTMDAFGRMDLAGVKAADAVVVLNHPACRDTMAELGLALGLGKQVIVVNPWLKYSVFHHLCARVGTVKGAVELLRVRSPEPPGARAYDFATYDPDRPRQRRACCVDALAGGDTECPECSADLGNP